MINEQLNFSPRSLANTKSKRKGENLLDQIFFNY